MVSFFVDKGLGQLVVAGLNFPIIMTSQNSLTNILPVAGLASVRAVLLLLLSFLNQKHFNSFYLILQ